MHPMTVLPTRRAPGWRGPVLLAAAGLAATVVVLLRRPALRPRMVSAWRRRGN